MTEAPRSYPEAERLRRVLTDKEIGKSIGAFLGMSGITSDDVARIRELVGYGVPAQGQPNLKQIEAAIDDHLGNIDATYEDSRRRCAQSILNLYALPSTESK